MAARNSGAVTDAKRSAELITTPLRAVTAGQFDYRICNITSNQSINDPQRIYGLHSMR